jgi:hypothetical protein
MPADPKSRVLAWAGVRKPPMHEPAGPARRGYGDLRSLVPCRRGRGNASALLTTGDVGRGWTARTLVGPFSGGRRTGAGTIRPVMAVAVALGIHGPDGRSGTAPARGRSWSRRLTTPSSRSRRVVHGVERHRGRSRRRPCGRRSMGMAAVDRAAARCARAAVSIASPEGSALLDLQSIGILVFKPINLSCVRPIRIVPCTNRWGKNMDMSTYIWTMYK